MRDDIDTGGDRTVTAAPAFETATWEELVEIWQNLDLPNAAWRAEIIEGRVVMTRPPENAHNLIADLVHGELRDSIPKEWAIFQTSGIKIPERKSLCTPDLVVIPRSDVLAGKSSILADKALLVVEITSRGNADDDRTRKLWGYGHAGIPLYLLIDRFASDGPTVTLFSQPTGGRYLHQHRVVFGEPVELPEPFGITLDTSQF
ncbi:Uma2 family endonuclease [Saccharopolyspora pogona]|uniref:Uma2 family endonuclease n=1 Tax=Saccharopolyspora pogona TaxID=333966 RepID=UPI001CC266C0|nr:Uma2 family endonuclease [Saccharopolyspora pogona]